MANMPKKAQGKANHSAFLTFQGVYV